MRTAGLRCIAIIILTLGGFALAEAPKMNELSPNDKAEIRAAIDGMDRAWNTHDMKAYVSYMTEDADWVNVVGMWWKGRDQVYRAHDAYHQTIFKHRQLHEPETVSLRGIAPDVVIATIVQMADGFTTPDGRVEPPDRAVLTEVFVRRNGRWLLTEGHNTTVVEAAQRSNPIKDAPHSAP